MLKLTSLVSFVLVVILLTSCSKDDFEMNTPPAVILSADTTIAVTVADGDSIILSGSATDKEGPVVAYLWSQVSGPNTAVISAAGSPTTFIKGVVSGTYVFQLIATDNNGATGVKSIRAKISAPQIVNLTLQPHQNPNDVLLAVNYTGNVSDKSAPELVAAAWTLGGNIALARGIFKFDLSAIPVNANIISAKLTLYSNPTPLNGDLIHANFGSNNSMFLQKVTSNWTNNLTWQNQPTGDAATQIAIPHTNKSLEDLADLDVTSMVKSMTTSNFGFLIKLQNESFYNSRIFCSSKYSDATKHPKLVIQYAR